MGQAADGACDDLASARDVCRAVENSELRGASFLDSGLECARSALSVAGWEVLLSVLGWLAAPNTLPPSESRTRGLVPTLLFACVVFLFPASFVLWGYASKVIVLSGNVGKRILILFRT